MNKPLSVSTESVLCRLEHKDLRQSAEAHDEAYSGMIMSLKMTLSLQNAMAETNNCPEDKISLADWGRMIVLAGLSAMAAAEEQEQGNESTTAE